MTCQLPQKMHRNGYFIKCPHITQLHSVYSWRKLCQTMVGYLNKFINIHRLIVQVLIHHILVSVSLLSLVTVGRCFTMPAYSVLGGQKYHLWKLGTLIKPRKRTFQNHSRDFGPRDGARNDKQAYDGFIMRGRRLAFLVTSVGLSVQCSLVITQLKLRCG